MAIEILLVDSSIPKALGLTYEETNTGVFVLIPDLETLMKVMAYILQTFGDEDGWANIRFTCPTSILIAVQV